MSGLNRNWELVLAGPDDAGGIQKVFDDADFQGGISVRFSRAPDPYRSLQNDGERLIIPIARDTATKEVLATGACVIRPSYLNGVLCNTGYLTGMKILRSHRQKINCIKPAYRLIAEQAAEFSPFYYTTILEGNQPAINLLEKPHRGMPAYIYLGKYTVFCLGPREAANHKKFSFDRGHTESLSAFYRKHLPEYNLAPADEWLYGLDSGDFYSLRSPSGEILAACAVWSQQSYKQYIISGYSGIYKALSRLPIRRLGYPAMPKAGSQADYISLALWIVPEKNLEIAPLFLKNVLSHTSNNDFTMAGLFENHPLSSVVEKFRHIKYQSRLYAVDFDDISDRRASGILDSRPIMLEAGLL